LAKLSVSLRNILLFEELLESVKSLGPLGRSARLELLELSGAPNHLARISKRAKLAEGNRLNQDISCRCGFGRASEDRNSNRVGSELVQEFVVAAAADNVEAFDFETCDLLDLVKGSLVEQGEAFQRASNVCALCCGNRLAGSTAKFRDLRGHIFGREKFFGRWVDEAGEWFRLGREFC